MSEETSVPQGMSIAAPDQVGERPAGAGFWPFVLYFLKLGALGFGGPVALAGFMHRDLVEQRRLIDEDEYKLALALAQIMPGPLAAQPAIALGYFQHGVLGATAAGLAFKPLFGRSSIARVNDTMAMK